MMVRAAVLKMKDPRQIIRDMEKLDEMGERCYFFRVTVKLAKDYIHNHDGEQEVSSTD